jgi:hypothetical protein
MLGGTRSFYLQSRGQVKPPLVQVIDPIEKWSFYGPTVLI